MSNRTIGFINLITWAALMFGAGFLLSVLSDREMAKRDCQASLATELHRNTILDKALDLATRDKSLKNHWLRRATGR